MGADRGRRLGRVGRRRSRSTCSARSCCAARCCRTSSAGGYGKIIQLSGGGATNPLPRHQRLRGVEGRGRPLRRDAGARGARRSASTSTAIAPGALNTRMLDEVLAAGPDAVGAGVLRALAEAERDEGGTPLDKGAALAVFLASAASDGITGKLLSAVWDPWADAAARTAPISTRPTSTRCAASCPADRGLTWGDASDAVGVAIIGCGLIGQKRATALGRRAARRLRRPRCASAPKRWRATAPGAVATDDWRAAVDRADVDIVIVATTNDALRRGHARRRSRPASTCSSRSRPRDRSPSSTRVIAAAARRATSGARRLQPSLSSGAPEGARARRRRRARRADVRARPLRPRRPRRLRQGVARRSGAVRRRRADRPGRAPDRSARWFLGDFTERRRASPHTYFWDMPVDDNAFLTAAHRATGRPRSCTSAAPSGRTCSRSRSTAATASSHIDGLGGSYGVERLTLLPDAAARWDRRRRRSGSIRAAIDRGRSSSPSSSTTSRLGRAARRRPRRRARGAGRRRGDLQRVRVMISRASMIITRSPLRITLGGGGTDLPSYYREHGGFLIAAAIDKYVYVTVMRPFTPGIFLKYSKLEHVEHDRRGAASDHPRGDPAARLPDAAARDHDAGRHPGGHRPRLVGQLHDGAAEGAVRASPPPAASRASSPSSPARSRSIGSASRSASRISTSPRTAASPASRSTATSSVEARPLTLPHGRRCSTSRTTCCCSSPASRAAPASILTDQKTRTEQDDARRCSTNLHYVKELGLRSQRGARARRHRAASAS